MQSRTEQKDGACRTPPLHAVMPCRWPGGSAPCSYVAFIGGALPPHRRLVAVTTMVSVGKIVQFCAGRLVELACSLDPIWTLRPRPLRTAADRSHATDQ